MRGFTTILALCSLLVVSLGRSVLPLDSVVKLVRSLGRFTSVDFNRYSDSKLYNALKMITTSQTAVKTLDGFTHQLRNAVKDSTSLKSRVNKFLNSKKKSKKEAAKVFEYTNSVERGLQSAEILQAISIDSTSNRENQLLNCGLVELKRCFLSHNDLNCTMSVLCSKLDESFLNSTLYESETMVSNFAKGELAIAFTDFVDTNKASSKRAQQKTLQRLLKILMRDKPVNFELSGSVTDDEIALQPSMLTLARYAIGNVSEYLLPETTSTHNNLLVSRKDKPELQLSTNGKMDSVFVSKKRPSKERIKHSSTQSKPSRRLPHRLRILGYSTGGAVASYLAMTLDGTLNFNPTSLKKDLDVRALAPFVGKYHGRVRCMTLGCPPCVSRSVVPQYITSLICGDDMVVRSTPETLGRFVRRVHRALKAGAGSGIPLGYMMGTGWMRDVAGSARQSLNRYTGSIVEFLALKISLIAFK